ARERALEVLLLRGDVARVAAACSIALRERTAGRPRAGRRETGHTTAVRRERVVVELHEHRDLRGVATGTELRRRLREPAARRLRRADTSARGERLRARPGRVRRWYGIGCRRRERDEQHDDEETDDDTNASAHGAPPGQSRLHAPLTAPTPPR